MNELHLAQRGQRSAAGSPHPVAGDGLPHAVRGAGSLRHQPRDRSRCASSYGNGEFANACLMARRLAERGVRIVADLLRQRPALGRPRRHRQPPQPRPTRATSPIAALLQRPESARPARRDAGHLGRRVRPHADLGRHQGPRSPQPSASPCGWPAAASRAA